MNKKAFYSDKGRKKNILLLFVLKWDTLIFALRPKRLNMKHLTKEQRYVISCLQKRGFSQEAIGKEIGFNKSTISRELKRNTGKRGVYNPEKAQMLANERKERFCNNRRFSSQMERFIITHIQELQWSPEEIVGFCKINDIEMVSTERIYQYIRLDKKNGGNLYKYLRHRLKHRKRPVGENKVKIKDRVSIDQRPDEINERKEFGHWEADLIEGKNHKGFILTLTERVYKQLFMCYLPSGKEAKGVAKAIISLLLPYKKFVRSITFDNGLEFAEHKTVSEILEAKTFFTHPYSSWEKGQIEYMNKLIRQYYPKNQEISRCNTKNIKEIQYKINSRPRKNLGFKKPVDLFYKFVNNKVAFAG